MRLPTIITVISGSGFAPVISITVARMKTIGLDCAKDRKETKHNQGKMNKKN
jgi:hypothetical protein